ncbi:probable multidrug resistance-associated protein lethal(2)03659 [Choristoneura fumiferana]|uniref:probable multidrug resistance-associated protein lethal(2)03659 n=1 Tax=Choristoneura fumiferana TaxID=7141 RepID=UPI003D157F9F
MACDVCSRGAASAGVAFFLEVVSILIVVCLVNWWLLLPTAFVACLLFLMRGLFLSTSRELKRIEAIARSQSLNHATATVSGLTTIRSTRAAPVIIAREFDKLQDLHSSAWTLVLNTNRAFGFWMDMICCLYLACVTFSFFFFASEDTIGGNVGLAITQVIGLVGMCQYGMRQTAEVENQMTSDFEQEQLRSSDTASGACAPVIHLMLRVPSSSSIHP